MNRGRLGQEIEGIMLSSHGHTPVALHEAIILQALLSEDLTSREFVKHTNSPVLSLIPPTPPPRQFSSVLGCIHLGQYSS